MAVRIRVTKGCGFPTTREGVSLIFPKGDYLVTEEVVEEIKRIKAGKDSPKIFGDLPDYSQMNFKIRGDW